MQGTAEPVIAAADEPKAVTPERGSALEVLRIFLRLGVTSFGGPVAHLGYYRAEFVERRKWLDEHTYADIVALWQFLPGPTSSQVGITLGIMRAGFLGKPVQAVSTVAVKDVKNVAIVAAPGRGGMFHLHHVSNDVVLLECAERVSERGIASRVIRQRHDHQCLAAHFIAQEPVDR